MPRRKKTDQSPARLPGGPQPEWGSLGHNTGYPPLPQGYQAATASSLIAPSAPVSSADKEKIVKSMQEVFSHLDPEVIYIVLSECDFKVENAMDSLLELSVAAEVTAPIPPPVSGFERTAAALLSPCHFSELKPDLDSSKPSQQPPSPPSPPSDNLTEELDMLVDQELETLTAQQDLVEHLPGASSMWEDKTTEGQEPVFDFTHLMTEAPPDKPKPAFDLSASGRPSAFQVYKKQEPSQAPSELPGLMHSNAIGGVKSNVNTLNQEPPSCVSSAWNLEAPVFSPHFRGKQGPTFTNPVALMPFSWPGQPRHVYPCLSVGPVSQAHLKSNAAIPKSWALPAAPQAAAHHSRLRLEGKVLVLLRGAPGSGKSTLARALLEYNPRGVVLSTDDYFTRNGQYHFDPTALGEAHDWNHKRAKDAFESGTNPIIIDNTNMQGWEMKPYIVQALKHGYKVLFREPDTWWKNKPRELERRSTHNVPVDTIRHMLNRYERFVSVQSIMGSQAPEWKPRLLLESSSSQPLSSEAPSSHLVEQPELNEEYKKSRPQLFSSLPDVSTIGQSGEVGKLEEGTLKSTVSLNFQLSGRPTENPDISDEDNIDLGELDSELDAQLEVNNPIGDQRIPDCIVESVTNEDQCGDEIPVAFSESIRQRVKRERPSRRSDFEMMKPADLVKDANQSDSEAKGKEEPREGKAEGITMVRYGEEEGLSNRLSFVGDWPSEGPLKQRQVRKKENHKAIYGQDNKGASVEASDDEKTMRVHAGPDVTEFQKLLDLIQTSVVPDQTDSSCSPSHSPSSGEELEREEEAGGSFDESHSSRSNSDERKQNITVNNSRGELPDCVLDWKAADSSGARELGTDDWEGLQIKSEASCTTERKAAVSEISREIVSVDLKETNAANPFSALTASLSVISKTAEACHNEDGNHSIEDGPGTDVDVNSYTDNGSRSENRIAADGSQTGKMCQSRVCEIESVSFIGGSQDRKQRQGRRSGKQCKLALTFTQNYPASSLSNPDCPDATDQNLDGSQNNSSSDISSNFSPITSLELKSNFDLLTKPKSEADLQPLAPLVQVDTGCFTQTEPQDFALLWRLNHQDGPDDTVITASSHCSEITVVSGDASRFVPELSSAVSAAVAVHPAGHREVPYRVVHEKGTQVEEKEFVVTQDHLESLRILSRHFKLVSFDTLEDLYDKCHQDLEWTTNLLLDSGERFFRDEDGVEEEEGGTAVEEDNNTSRMCGALREAVETSLCPNLLHEPQHEDRSKREPAVIKKGTQLSTCDTLSESVESANNTDVSSFKSATVPVINKDKSDTTTDLETSPQTELNLCKTVNEGERCDDTESKMMPEPHLEVGARGGSLESGAIIEESRPEINDEIATMEEVNRLLQAELEEIEREEKQRKKEKRSQHLDIQSVELKLPTELALQLAELFGPVGVDPGTCSADDCAVQMDLNMAKLLHQKWKETIQERQRQATLSFHLLQESSARSRDSQVGKPGPQDQTQLANFLISMDGYMPLDSQPEAWDQVPFMDHWNASRPHVSFRDIIKEEQALQRNVDRTRQSRADLDRRDGATLLKENQLYSLFPNMDKHFLQDIFRDHNYSLTQTELFLRSLLIEEPVKTVVAPEAPRFDHHRATSKERQKPVEVPVPGYQDIEDPEYEDFRAEANLQRRRQLESFSKAADAYKQGRKEVASFYAQQGHLHGHRMREANHRAAAQIFERVNASLLPNNILDLHGLHVHEALQHLAQVLQNKTADYERGLCRPKLSVITGRGNHSQGGVARIRPAVIDYLTNKHYKFTEPKPGLVLVSLK